jgi:hypothetical protein
VHESCISSQQICAVAWWTISRSHPPAVDPDGEPTFTATARDMRWCMSTDTDLIVAYHQQKLQNRN